MYKWNHRGYTLDRLAHGSMTLMLPFAMTAVITSASPRELIRLVSNDSFIAAFGLIRSSAIFMCGSTYSAQKAESARITGKYVVYLNV